MSIYKVYDEDRRQVREDKMRGQEQTETFSVAVPSASIEDKQWIVTFVGSCQCPAFSWRRKCRHVTEAMDALEALVNVGHELAEEDKP